MNIRLEFANKVNLNKYEVFKGKLISYVIIMWLLLWCMGLNEPNNLYNKHCNVWMSEQQHWPRVFKRNAWLAIIRQNVHTISLSQQHNSQKVLNW